MVSMALCEEGLNMQSPYRAEIEHIHERLRAERLSAELRRMAAVYGRPGGLARQAARPLARVLLRLGARLLCYANAERAPMVATGWAGARWS